MEPWGPHAFAIGCQESWLVQLSASEGLDEVLSFLLSHVEDSSALKALLLKATAKAPHPGYATPHHTTPYTSCDFFCLSRYWGGGLKKRHLVKFPAAGRLSASACRKLQVSGSCTSACQNLCTRHSFKGKTPFGPGKSGCSRLLLRKG